MILGEDPKHVSQLNINLSLLLSPILNLRPWPGVQRLHLGVIWRRRLEIAHFHLKNCDFHKAVEKALSLLHLSLKSSDLA